MKLSRGALSAILLGACSSPPPEVPADGAVSDTLPPDAVPRDALSTDALPTDALPTDALPTDGPSLSACLSLRGASQLLPDFNRNTSPHGAQHMAPELARDGVSLAPHVRIGEWSEQQQLPRGAHDSDGVYFDGWFYTLGGQRERLTGEASLLAAALMPDGTLGEWRTGTPYAYGIIDHLLTPIGGRVYLTGGARSLGNDSFRQVRESWVALPSMGDVNPWTPGPQNPVQRFGHQVAAPSATVYTLGGDDGQTATDDVSFATVRPDGSLSEWRSTTRIPFGVIQFQDGAFTARRVYVFGGCRRRDCQVRNNIDARILVADLAPDGTLSAWREGGELPVRNFDFKVLQLGGRVFVSGGRPGGFGRCTDIGGDNYTQIWRADLNPDGSFGAWSEETRMPRPRSDHQITVDDQNHVWIWGGRTSCAPGETRDYNNNYPRSVWRADLIPEPGFARTGSWTSGPLRVDSRTLQSLRWSATGPGMRARLRSASRSQPNIWSIWTDPTSEALIALPEETSVVQVQIEAEGDGESSAVLRAVELYCR